MRLPLRAASDLSATNHLTFAGSKGVWPGFGPPAFVEAKPGKPTNQQTHLTASTEPTPGFLLQQPKRTKAFLFLLQNLVCSDKRRIFIFIFYFFFFCIIWFRQKARLTSQRTHPSIIANKRWMWEVTPSVTFCLKKWQRKKERERVCESVWVWVDVVFGFVVRGYMCECECLSVCEWMCVCTFPLPCEVLTFLGTMQGLKWTRQLTRETPGANHIKQKH